MYILNFAELFNQGKLNKDNYIVCNKDQSLALIKCGFMPVGEFDKDYVFIKDEIIELFLKGGGDICYTI